MLHYNFVRCRLHDPSAEKTSVFSSRWKVCGLNLLNFRGREPKNSLLVRYLCKSTLIWFQLSGVRANEINVVCTTPLQKKLQFSLQDEKYVGWTCWSSELLILRFAPCDWKMKNGKLMKNGKWMENGKWKRESEWKLENGKWRAAKVSAQTTFISFARTPLNSIASTGSAHMLSILRKKLKFLLQRGCKITSWRASAPEQISPLAKV